MSNNRKRTKGRYNQSIACENGQIRQIKHSQVPSQSAHDPWGMSKAKRVRSRKNGLFMDNQWISVKDKLPEHGEVVMAAIPPATSG